ncbi:MAG: GNAT family N-acetyltransferase [Phycisphaerae bacterium]|nr:GNAT family N-acetyltransferase [Phycisphaerae bacterium]
MPPAQTALNLRPLRPDEVPRLLDLIRCCYAEYGLTLNLQDECERHLADPINYFRAQGGDLWVLPDQEGAVRASGALYLHRHQPAPIAELKCMYVDPSLRRRGIGRSITEHILNAARLAGCNTIELWSDTRFEAAHRMYEASGFERFGRRDIADSNNSSEWGYRRTL